MLTERRGFGVGRVWFFDIQGWITLILGGLLALITLFTSYSHVHLPFLGAIALNLGFPRFGGHRSGIHVGDCTSSHELLLVINRAEVAQR